jgi:hypothetical protein
MAMRRVWLATRITRSLRSSGLGSRAGPAFFSTTARTGTVLVSSLLIVGVSGCSALSSLMSGGTGEEAAVTMAPEEAADQPTMLETIVDGARVEMPGSGFAITFPGDWVVEMADPDPDVFTAAPGDAWEALQAYGPERREACSVVVAIAPFGQESSGVGTGGGSSAPLWSTEEEGLILLVRSPRIETVSGGAMGTIAPHERPRSSDPRLDHDVQYVVVCETDRDRFLHAITQSVEFLPSDG